jgi:diguanylate cyclase (GGDEF)-like protein
MRYGDFRQLIAGEGSSSNQIYNILCFVSFFFGVFAGAQSWLAGLSSFIVAANLVFSVLFAFQYFISRFLGRLSSIWIVGAAFLIFFFIPILWVFNGGTASGMAYIVILFVSFIVVLATADKARRRERTFVGLAMCLLVAVVGFLLWLEFSRPELIYEYPNRTVRFLDIAVSMIIAVTGNFLIVRTYVSQHYRDFARIQKYSETLEVLVQTDAMTGLLNHAHGIARLGIEVSKAHRYNRALSIVMIDLDFFKSVNDDFGHQAGDDVIVCVAESLRRCCRVFDIPIRYGGEEFLLILPETGRESAGVVGDRLRKLLGEAKLCIPRKITVSGGIVECGPDDTADSMIKRADGLLYRAKQTGRDRIVSEGQ